MHENALPVQAYLRTVGSFPVNMSNVSFSINSWYSPLVTPSIGFRVSGSEFRGLRV